MLTYCLKCIRNTKKMDAEMIKTENSRTMIYQNVLHVAVKNQDL